MEFTDREAIVLSKAALITAEALQDKPMEDISEILCEHPSACLTRIAKQLIRHIETEGRE